MRTAFVMIVSACILSACGGPRSAVRYSGSEEPSIVSPEELGEASSLPDGYDRLGKISAECRYDKTPGALDGEWLSDVDCSVERLQRAIREKAADAGAELLVGLGCWSRGDEDDDELDVFCRAELARPSDELLERRALARNAPRPDVEPGPRASEAWRIRVSFTPAPGVAARTPRRGDLVREVPLFPVSHVRLGDVVTECASGCSLPAVRQGVLSAAARLGATDVVDVRCAARDDGWMCSGTAAAYEVDPEVDARIQ